MAIDSNGSEGDAYRYTKKVLNALPNRNDVCAEYTELMEDRNKELPEHSKVSSWTRCAYMELRSYFFKDGVSKIRFAPGIARIAFGELNLGQETENTDALMRLHEILRIISIAHANEYTRHLGKDDHLYTFEELQEIYGTKISGQWSAMKRRLNRKKYGPRRYNITELTSFEVASQFGNYVNWCHVHGECMYNHYKHTSILNEGRCQVSTVRLYVATLPGFEKLTPEDEDYDNSMLAIDVGPAGRLVHVTVRRNSGDNYYTEEELSDLLGGPFYKICPPLSNKEVYALTKEYVQTLIQRNSTILEKKKRYTRACNRGRSYGIGTHEGKFVDTRDGNVYRTRRAGGLTWMLDPLRYMPEHLPKYINRQLDSMFDDNAAGELKQFYLPDIWIGLKVMRDGSLKVVVVDDKLKEKLTLMGYCTPTRLTHELYKPDAFTRNDSLVVSYGLSGPVMVTRNGKRAIYTRRSVYFLSCLFIGDNDTVISPIISGLHPGIPLETNKKFPRNAWLASKELIQAWWDNAYHTDIPDFLTELIYETYEFIFYQFRSRHDLDMSGNCYANFHSEVYPSSIPKDKFADAVNAIRATYEPIVWPSDYSIPDAEHELKEMSAKSTRAMLDASVAIYAGVKHIPTSILETGIHRAFFFGRTVLGRQNPRTKKCKTLLSLYDTQFSNACVEYITPPITISRPEGHIDESTGKITYNSTEPTKTTTEKAVVYPILEVPQLIPDGWHIPTLEESYQLWGALGGRPGSLDIAPHNLPRGLNHDVAVGHVLNWGQQQQPVENQRPPRRLRGFIENPVKLNSDDQYPAIVFDGYLPELLSTIGFNQLINDGVYLPNVVNPSFQILPENSDIGIDPYYKVHGHTAEAIRNNVNSSVNTFGVQDDAFQEDMLNVHNIDADELDEIINVARINELGTGRIVCPQLVQSQFSVNTGINIHICRNHQYTRIPIFLVKDKPVKKGKSHETSRNN